MKKKLTVIIPSRASESQLRFLERAAGSVRQQTVANDFDIEILVAVDEGQALAAEVCDRIGIRCVESDGRSQAAALNAAIRVLDSDYVGFLEDDDQWTREFLRYGSMALERCAFSSSTHAEFDEDARFLRINDYPSPSGWLMPAETLRKVGEFDESYRYHLDCEWLGRLRESGIKRIHLVEATAPVDLQYARRGRPGLANAITHSGHLSRLYRHRSPYPLVNRLVHSGSGMARIRSDPAVREKSKAEFERLRLRYGVIPW